MNNQSNLLNALHMANQKSSNPALIDFSKIQTID